MRADGPFDRDSGPASVPVGADASRGFFRIHSATGRQERARGRAYLNQQLGFYGAAQNRVSAATDQSNKLGLDFQTALGVKQDADMAQAILDLNQTKIQEQASLTARAQMRKTSLFDYLG